MPTDCSCSHDPSSCNVQVWAKLFSIIASLRHRAIAWDLLYLGRNRHGPDGPPVYSTAAPGPGGVRVVRAGFSTCAHAYVLSRRGVAKLLALGLHSAVSLCPLPPAL